ncbi:hypothetical protein ACFYXD_29060 [Streptomyces platensis]|uniref:hypothetical protein n=1 Tax=Streptomyces platensis TaxID=58346 RepID=UPI0036B0BC9A
MDRLDRLTEMARNHYVSVAAGAMGRQGTSVLREFLPKLKEIHRCVDYESINVALTVFYVVGQESHLDYATAYRVSDPSMLALHNDGVLTVEVRDDGSYFVWKEKYDPDGFNSSAVVYHYEPNQGEKFWVDGSPGEVPPSVGFARLFGVSRFEDLAQCLEEYSVKLARSSECQIIGALWREEGRVMWKPGPESRMRASLYQHLKSGLRHGNPDITQETNVDDANPIDIQVKWENSNRIALIEIKWLGRSGVLDPHPRQTKEWTEARARSGLRQLAEYLDLLKSRAGSYDRRGFLFIFDARRANVKPEAASVSRRDGLAYQDRHISYDPDLLNRSDMAAPVRCFCEPNFATGVSPSRNKKSAT